MPDEQNPQVPAEEYPIDFLSDAPPANRGAASTPASRGRLPPPVSGDRDWPRAVQSSRVGDFWAVLRHADVRRVLRDPGLFSSQLGAHRVPAAITRPEQGLGTGTAATIWLVLGSIRKTKSVGLLFVQT